MILDRILVIRAPPHRMRALDDVTEVVQPIKLPFNKLLVSRIDRCEPPAPVDGESDLPHHSLCLPAEIFGKRFRRVERLKHVHGDAVQFRVDPHGAGIAFCDQFGKTYERGACCMKTHREEDVSSEHPLVSGYNIAYGECSGMAGM